MNDLQDYPYFRPMNFVGNKVNNTDIRRDTILDQCTQLLHLPKGFILVT